MSDNDRGLYKKYHVKRVIDPLGKHADCEYFVLDPKHDPLAREALSYYMGAALREGQRELAADINKLLGRTQGEPAASQES